MNNFIFWQNLNKNNLNIDRVKHALASTTNSGKFEQLFYNESDGLMFCYRNNRPLLQENDKTLFFSANNDINYKNSQGLTAAQTVINDFTNSGKIDISLFSNNFSFLLINKSTATITVAIDRFGIENLYYCKVNNTFVVSSSIEAILALHPASFTISNQAIFEYIYSHIIPSPFTIYNEIYKLEPSQAITVTEKNLTSEIYWLPHFSEAMTKSINNLEEETRSLLNEAVKKLNTSETTAAFLSGGLDSSTVSGYLAKTSTKQVSTYTMGFAEAGYDETEYAKIAAKHFNTKFRSLYVTPNDVANVFSDVITSYDEPFGNSSAIPSYLCANFAKSEGKTTILAGDGGDEIFAGNERYAKQMIFEYYEKMPNIARKNLLEPIFLNSLPYTKIFPFSKLKSYIEQANISMPDRMERYNFINHFNASTIFTHDFLASINQNLSLEQKRKVYNRPDEASMLNRMLYMDWKFTLADNDLIKVSQACKLAGIKVRYPMLDTQLVEFSTRLPSALKMERRQLRSFYKKTFKGFLPLEIINKPKQGFGLPFGEWLKKSPKLQEQIYDNLSSLKHRNIINKKFIDEIIHIHRTQKASSYYGNMVWILAVLQVWSTSRRL